MLLAGGGTKFDVEAASAAATITDTVLGRNSSDTLLEDGSGVISGEITGVKAVEEPDEGITGNSSSAKIFREKKGFGDESYGPLKRGFLLRWLSFVFSILNKFSSSSASMHRICSSGFNKALLKARNPVMDVLQDGPILLIIIKGLDP